MSMNPYDHKLAGLILCTHAQPVNRQAERDLGATDCAGGRVSGQVGEQVGRRAGGWASCQVGGRASEWAGEKAGG